MENDLTRTLEIVVAGFVGGFAGIIIDIYKKTMNDLGFSLFIFSLLFIFLVILVYIILKIFKNSENISIKIKKVRKMVKWKEVAKFAAGITFWEFIVHLSLGLSNSLPLNILGFTITRELNTVQIIVPLVVSLALIYYAWIRK